MRINTTFVWNSAWWQFQAQDYLTCIGIYFTVCSGEIKKSSLLSYSLGKKALAHKF